MDTLPPLQNRELPEPPHWRKALGVGVVVMGLAIGTGELILWPHLITKHGLGLLWLALLGITFQYFLNQEVARHEIATGEGFFTTSARVIRWSSFFWLFSAVLLYIWPGWASSIGTTLKELFGFGSHLGWSLITLALVLVLTFSGRVAYTMLEKSLKITVPAFFVMLVAISFYNLSFSDLGKAVKGALNFGNIPQGVDMNVLLGAIVFAGAGGMLNLCVSLWYRDKQAGMGKYIGRITNPITGREEAVAATGYTFDEKNEENMKRWRGWMRYVRIDQGVVFWLLGFITLFLLSANAYTVLSPRGLVPGGLDVAVVQANIFGEQWGPIGFKLFLAMAFLMLFSVMWTVIDALTRMVSDIIYTNSHVGSFTKVFGWFKNVSLSKLYYFTITAVVLAGAFLIPLINKVTADPKENVLIVVPTRELAIQINEELKEFSKHMNLHSVCCVGGAHIGQQISGLKRPHRFVIGTPGRLKDLIQRRVLDLARFKSVVLDEADRMLDMGFLPDMRFMMARLPKERHTLFFSATLSREIETLIKEFLREPVSISVKTQDTAKNVDQDVVRVKPGALKLDVLHDLLIQPEFSKVLIFGKTKHGVENLSKILVKRGFKAESIHGDKNQSKRQKALGLFKDNRAQILVATDVAARGLDISGISHVINYDIPATYDDYIHRIGRTGRAGKKGKALTFVEHK